MARGGANPALCPTCGELGPEEQARQKWGWPEHDTALPAAAGRLETVRDLGSAGSRTRELRRCPTCGAWFLYRTDYEYLTNGSEDEQTLTRLEPAEAAELLAARESGESGDSLLIAATEPERPRA